MATTTPLNTPKRVIPDQTSLQDETHSIFDDIDPNDPLILEGKSANLPTHEPPRKKKVPETKGRSEEEHVYRNQATPDYQPIVQAIEQATRALTDAIDRNSRAVRCQDATIGKLVREMEYFNRQYRNQRESSCTCKSTGKRVQLKGGDNKEKRDSKPTVKSVVVDKVKK